MKTILMLSAVTARERNDATQFVFDRINACGGWVEDVRMFSNKMTNIRLTLPEKALLPLLGELAEGGVKADPPAETLSSTNDRERPATLQITFIHNEPDLKREVPAVPG